MTVTCPGCGWSAEVPEDKIPDGGITATCRKCQTKFGVKKESNPVTEHPQVIPNAPQRDTKPCPLCGEEILAVAKKCRHCNSMLDEVNEKLLPAQESKQTAKPTEPAPEKKEAEYRNSAAPKERTPLSSLEKVLFVVFGFAVAGGLSSNNPVAPAMLFIYIGALAFRLRKKNTAQHSLETKVATPPANKRAIILLATLGILMLIVIPIISKTSRDHAPSVKPSVQPSTAERVIEPSPPPASDSTSDSSV